MTSTSAVSENAAEHRFEMDIDGQRAVAQYEVDGDIVTFTHTEVPESLRGRGIGTRIIEASLAAVRARRQKVVPQCPMFAAYMQKHPETRDLLAPGVDLT